MKISIVIPTLNEEKVLPKLLGDLSMQTDPDFEVVVSDGNSDDKTVELANGFKKKIKNLSVIVSKKRGASHQRNVGAKESKGEWILFLDADDRLKRQFVKGLKSNIKNHDVDCFTHWCNVDSKEKADRLIAVIINVGIELGKNTNYPIALGSLIGVKRKAFDAIHGFDEKILFCEDTNFVQQCAKKGFKFEVFRKPRYTFSLRRARKMGRMNFVRKSVVLNSKHILGMKIMQEEYPMGGFIEHLKEEDLLEKLNKKFISLVRKNTYINRVNEIYRKLIAALSDQ